MSKQTIDGAQFLAMFRRGAQLLKANEEQINALNVFPVPDGDTGTNMNMTVSSGIRKLETVQSVDLSLVAEQLATGLLFGARGNSGVILSQLFRGFAKSLAGVTAANSIQLAHALQAGVDAAYKAVVKPIEGTILTVAKDTAKYAVEIARWNPDVSQFMSKVHKESQAALRRTPDLLPILKQVGVVDSGGQGLVYIYEGFVQVLTGEYTEERTVSSEHKTAIVKPAVVPTSAQAQLNTEDIEFLYDMEFFIRRGEGSNQLPFDEEQFKQQLAIDGDCILVISDDTIIKVHVHSRKPGDVLNYALPYGELTDFHILNMREQHRDIVHEPSFIQPSISPVMDVITDKKPFAMIAVAMGDGIANVLRSSHVDVVLSGGQTMNPSTADFVQAIESLAAEHIFILPNNSNIILAAQQAAELVACPVTVIPTKTIPQGVAAALAFHEHWLVERNTEVMLKAAGHVMSGQITNAVRDTSIDGVDIGKGQFIAMLDKTIVGATDDLQEACRKVLAEMIERGGELVSIYTGEQATQQQTTAIVQWLEEQYTDIEVEVYSGDQPLYPYLFGVE